MKVKGIAHRGYPVKYPENTITAFHAAIELGYSHLEIDVHLSKDGVPVIMHDKTVTRTTDGSGLIKDHTLKELKELSIRQNETVPTLEETLALAKGKIRVAVELKQQGDLYPGLEKNDL